MNMNDEETVALIAGGHTFGKSHGAAQVSYQGELPENAPLENQGFGYTSSYKSGMAEDTITSGLEGAWTYEPTQWDNNYWENLFRYQWECVKGPGGKWQWTPKDVEPNQKDAHIEGMFHKPMMFTTDIALKADPSYGEISTYFYNNPKKFHEAFAKAWFKLLHRDLGPSTRLLGPEVPPPQLFQDPIPELDHTVINDDDIETLKKEILSSMEHVARKSGVHGGGMISKVLGKSHNDNAINSLTPAHFIKTAWASASTFRRTDYRGGANGARIRFMPQRQWEVNDPQDLDMVLTRLEEIQTKFNQDPPNIQANKRVSMADLIVLAGCTGLEVAAQQAGHKNVSVPFASGRMDAVEEQTDVDSFAFLEPAADGFRNYYNSSKTKTRPEELLVDQAHKLSLTAPEMVVLVAGLRAVGATSGDSAVGVLTDQPGSLTNEYLLNLLSMDYKWEAMPHKKKGVVDVDDTTNSLYNGKIRSTGEDKWTASRVDLAIASQSELRAIAEFYACDDSAAVFVQDFIKAFVKVMELDRYDLQMSHIQDKQGNVLFGRGNRWFVLTK